MPPGVATGPAVHPPTGLEAWARRRESSVGRLSVVASDLQHHLTEALAHSGHHGLRPSFAPVLQSIREEGRAISRIAEELGVSPQAASRSAALLEDVGYVERTPNPSDGRSKLLVLTGRGRQLVEQGTTTILRREADYGQLVGPARVRQLARDVATLRQGLGLAAPAHPVHAGSGDSIGGVILVALQAKGEIVQAASALGHAGIRASHHDVLAVIGPAGARASEIARVQQVSRQAISTTVQELESLGYVQRRPDDRDRRGIVLTMTGRGVALGRDVLAAVDAIEARYRAILGDRRFTRFERTLADIDGAIRAAGVRRHSRTASPASAAAGALRAATDEHDLEHLARWLRDRLGHRDARRLAGFLVAEGEPARRGLRGTAGAG